MDGFHVDPQLFSKAESSVASAIDGFSSVSSTVSDVTSSIPDGYKYTGEVNSICDQINKVKNYAGELSGVVASTKKMLTDLDSSFGQEIPKEEEKEGSFFSGIKDFFVSINESRAKTAAAWGKGFSSLFKGKGFGDLGEAFEQTKASLFVELESAKSGSLKIVEGIVDGITFLGGYSASGYVGVFDKIAGTDYAHKIRQATTDHIRRDLVGEGRKYFYENTKVGKTINAKSNLKYDSAGAKGIYNISQFTGKLALAVGVTIATGGVAAPAAIGAVFGAGSGVERYAQTVNREAGEDYNYAKVGAKAIVSAGAEALEWAAWGSMGAGALNAAGIATNSVKTTGSKASTSFMKNFVTKRNIAESAAVISDHGVNIAFGDETLKEALVYGGSELATSVALNALFAGFETKGARNASKAATQSLLDKASDLNTKNKVSKVSIDLSSNSIDEGSSSVFGNLTSNDHSFGFKKDIEKSIKELESNLSDAAKVKYSNSIHPAFGNKSKLEVLLQAAIESEDFDDKVIQKQVKELITENISDYLSGNNKQLKSQIIDFMNTDKVKKALDGVDVETFLKEDSRALRSGSLFAKLYGGSTQSALEDKITSYIIKSPEFDVDAKAVAKNISSSIDKKGYEFFYEHIITYDDTYGGYHKVGAPEFLGDERKVSYQSFAHKPTNNNIKVTTGEESKTIVKSTFPNDLTHQQIMDLTLHNIKTADPIEKLEHNSLNYIQNIRDMELLTSIDLDNPKLIKTSFPQNVKHFGKADFVEVAGKNPSKKGMLKEIAEAMLGV